VRVILTSLPLLLISWLLVRLVLCFLVTPQTTRGTATLTSPPAGSLSPDTLCLTSQISPSPPPLHPPPTTSWTPCFRLTRWFNNFCLLVRVQQVSLVHRHRFQRSLLRHARHRSPPLRPARHRSHPLRHARPRSHLLHLPRGTPSPCGSTSAVWCRPLRRIQDLRLRSRWYPRGTRLLCASTSAVQRSRPHRQLHRSRRTVLRLALTPSQRCTTRTSSIGILDIFIPW